MAKLLTVKEAAERLGISPSKLYRMTWSGEIYTQRIGRAVRVPETALDALTSVPARYVSSFLNGGNK